MIPQNGGVRFNDSKKGNVNLTTVPKSTLVLFILVVDEEKLIGADKMLNSWLDGNFRVLSELQYECFEIMSYEDDEIYIIEAL